MSAWAIVAAAGQGSRLGVGPKAFARLGGSAMVAHSLVAFAKAPGIDAIVLVVPAGFEDEARSVASSAVPAARVEVVTGAQTRRASVHAGLAAVPADVDRVVVHDAARPLVSVALIEAVLDALDHSVGAVAAVAESDTLKRATQEHSADRPFVTETVPRAGLWRAQTPQAFHAPTLRLAHARAAAEAYEATDDAVLLERAGERVALVPGDERNLKVTTPDDLALAERLLDAARGGA